MPSFLIDLPAVAAALVLVAAPAACPSSAPPVEVDVSIVHNQQPIVTDKTSQQLTAEFRYDPDATSSTDGLWMVGGLNQSVIGGSYKVQYEQRVNPQTGGVCVAPHKVQFDIVYTNTIYIAQDFKSMGCRYSATMAHEKRHVNADLRVLDKHLSAIRDALHRAASKIGVRGPFSGEQLAEVRRDMTELIAAGADKAMTDMREDRRKRQADIDTHENYLRDTALCPDQFPKFDGSPN